MGVELETELAVAVAREVVGIELVFRDFFFEGQWGEG